MNGSIALLWFFDPNALKFHGWS
jgi:hypothetical protein